jgi:hypothetical protein
VARVLNTKKQLEFLINAVKKSLNGSAGQAKSVDLSGYATRYDLLQTKGELKEEISAIKVEMHKLHTDMIRWFIGTAIATTAVIVTLLKFWN